MYKQVGLGILIIAPLIADFASRHTGAPASAAPVAVEGLPPGAVELKGPPGSEGQPMPAPQNGNMFQNANMQNGQIQTVPGLPGGLDPSPTLDPTPGGSTPPPPATPPQPAMAAPAMPQPFTAPPGATPPGMEGPAPAVMAPQPAPAPGY